MSTRYDLVIRGGLLVDPSQGIHARKDIAFHQGRVNRVEDRLDVLPRKGASQIIDASGLIVIPGLIDIHTHARRQLGSQPAWSPDADWTIGVDPDRFLATGVTTAVDAGSYGVDGFPLTFPQLAASSRARVFAWLNLLPSGLAGKAAQRYLDKAAVPRIVDLYERNKQHIVGLKVLLSRRYWQNWGTASEYLDIAREAAAATGLPIMVHGLRSDEAKWPGGIALAELFDRLQPGDIATHCFCQYKSFVAWDAVDAAREAVDRGVLLDVGHGTGSFSFDVAARALELGLPPTTISTDIHHMNYTGPVYDMTTTMSKFLLLGMSLDEVVEKSTAAPARALNMEGELGTLQVGATADAVILDMLEGEFQFEDSYSNSRIGKRKLVPIAVVRDGIPYLGGTWSAVGGVPPGPLYSPEVLGQGLNIG